jgi:hypothetical protein
MARHFDARQDSEVLRRATTAFVHQLLDDVLPPLRLAARGCGYALTVHGSLARDIDLVAVPWEERADEPELLVQRISGVLAGIVGRAYVSRRDKWTDKPHGRVACTIIMPGDCPEIDLSIMPRKDRVVDDPAQPDEGQDLPGQEGD